MAEQDEIVEIIRRALCEYHLPGKNVNRHAWRAHAEAVLSALTAAGCEVVQWRDYLTDDASPSDASTFQQPVRASQIASRRQSNQGEQAMTETADSDNPARFTRLDDCKHCGGKAMLENAVTEAKVFCTECGVKVIRKHPPQNDNGIDRAIAAWNRRVPDKQAALSGTVAPPAGLVDK